MDIHRQIKCSRCGAAVEPRRGKDIAFCKYCGSYSNPDGTVYKPNPDKRSRELKAAMNEALEEDDIGRWRIYMYESCMLDVKRNPEVYKISLSDNDKLRGYVNKLVKQYELLNFDKGVKKAFAHCQQTVNRLIKTEDNYLSVCRDLLEAYRRYFRTFLNHPEYPFETIPGDAEQQALDITRSAINQLKPKWGENIINPIISGLFGDRETGKGKISCDSCGFRLDIGKSSTLKCPNCGSVIYLNK